MLRIWLIVSSLPESPTYRNDTPGKRLLDMSGAPSAPPVLRHPEANTATNTAVAPAAISLRLPTLTSPSPPMIVNRSTLSDRGRAPPLSRGVCTSPAGLNGSAGPGSPLAPARADASVRRTAGTARSVGCPGAQHSVTFVFAFRRFPLMASGTRSPNRLQRWAGGRVRRHISPGICEPARFRPNRRQSLLTAGLQRGRPRRPVVPHGPAPADAPTAVLAGLAVAALGIATVLLLLVVRPRIGGHDRASFPRWARLDEDGIRACMTGDTRAARVRVLSLIALGKFRRLRRAVECTLTALAFLALAAVAVLRWPPSSAGSPAAGRCTARPPASRAYRARV
ncbi:Pycsar system effector family protein [Streptomyces spiralis]